MLTSLCHAADFDEVLRESWQRHLSHNLPNATLRDQHTVWYAAQALADDPKTELALNILMRSYEANGEVVLAGALAHHATNIGITNQVIKPAPYRKKLARYFAVNNPVTLRESALPMVNNALEAMRTEEGFVRMEGIEKSLREILQEPGATAEILSRLASLYQAQGRYAESYICANLFLHYEPRRPSMIELQQANLKQLSDEQLTRLFIQHTASKQAEYDPRFLPDLLQQALDLNMADEAVRLARKWASTERENGAAWQMLGDMLWKTGEPERALVALLHATKKERHTAKAYLLIAKIYARKLNVADMKIWLKKYRQNTDAAAFAAALTADEFSKVKDQLTEFK